MKNEIIPAGELNGNHINRVATFDWRLPLSRISVVVTGSIREIHHDGQGHVYLWMIPADADMLEEGHEKQDFTLSEDDPIELLP